ncbi:hypothetical protein K2X40_02675 [Candidatus Babeliales bacterium]|nr:hypothetical protein [Candidatus Babeliales bacterium]
MKKQTFIFLTAVVFLATPARVMPAAEFSVKAPAGCAMIVMQLNLRKAPDRYGKAKKIKSGDVITEQMILDAYAVANDKEREGCASPNKLFGTPSRLGTPGRSSTVGISEAARDYFLEYIYLALLGIDPAAQEEEELTDEAIAKKIEEEKEKAADDHVRMELLSRAELFFKRTKKK